LASCVAPFAVESTTRIVSTSASLAASTSRRWRKVSTEILRPLSLTARAKTGEELISCA
jgi:hypothetical protein